MQRDINNPLTKGRLRIAYIKRGAGVFTRCLAALLLATGVWAQDVTTVFLLRHAERTGTMRDDDPVSPAGEERSRLIARVLGETGVEAILVSETLRSRQTAAPLAEKTEVQPEVIRRGDLDGLAKALKRARGVIVAVRHREEMEGLMQKLGAGKVAAFEDGEYDRLLVITMVKGKVASVSTLRFGR